MRKVILIITAFLFSFNLPAQEGTKDVTLEELWLQYKFYPQSVSGLRSMKSGLSYTTIDKGENGQSINQYSYKSGEKEKTLVTAEDLDPEGKVEPIKIDDYKFNSDENKLLIATEQEGIYRYSTRSEYYVLDLKSKDLKKLSDGGKQSHATFSPTENKVAFVRDNDLWLVNLESGNEEQLTTTGKKNALINGMADWVYEEEFAFTKAFFWSPDGKRIAYYEFNEERVKEWLMKKYGGQLYPEEYRFKYPKAGEKNSIVNIYIHELQGGKKTKVDIGKETDQYIPRIKWTQDAATLSAQRMNRLQNELELLLVDATTGNSKVVLKESSETYIDITDNLTFLEDGRRFIWTSEADGYHHIYLYNLEGELINQVTKGNWVIDHFYGVDEENGKVYYSSAEEGPLYRAVYSIKLNGKDKTRITEKQGFNDADFSKGFQYFINTYSNAGEPPFISLHSADGKLIRELQTNEALKNTLKEYQLSDKEFTKVPTVDGIQLNAWMIKPPDFDENKKYPVFLTVYGGPGSQTVTDKWDSFNYFWHQMLAQQGYIVMSVDNRGTGFRGREFKHSTYMELGKLETEDYIRTAKYLMSLKYVDPARIGIQGWSYGGYMSSLCITKGAEQFAVAIAVAPVTNWRFYDTIYTERFMRTPQENPNGYDDNSPINHVEKLRGDYLLVHGMADDNVHFQNATEMVSALVNANKQFDLYIYPDRNHGIYGGNTRYHLYTKMTDFLKENL